MEVTLDLLQVALEEGSGGCGDRLVRALASSGYVVDLVRADSIDAVEALLAAGSAEPDLLITDPARDPAPCEQLLARVQGLVGDALPVVVVSAGLGEEAAVRLMRAGARDVVPENETSHLLAAIERELAKERVRRAAERSLRIAIRRADEQAALFELALEALAGGSISDCIDAALERGAWALDASVCFFAAREGSALQLDVRASRGLERVRARHRRALPLTPAGLARRVLEAEGPLVVDDFAGEARFETPMLLAEAGVAAGLFTAIRADGRGPGVLGFCCDHPAEFTRADAALVSAIARTLEAALLRAPAREAPAPRDVLTAEQALRGRNAAYAAGAGASAQAAEGDAGAAAGRSRAPRIVVVDDDPAVARVARRLLERHGCEVTVYQSATRALDFMREAIGRVDLVITDWAMPDLDGVTLMRELRALSPTLPIVLTSGDPGRLAAVQAENVGGARVLSKPFRGQDLAALIADALPDAQGQPGL